MSTKEIAMNIFNRLSEEQLKSFVKLFGDFIDIPEENPDEWDMEMIKRSKNDDSEGVPLEQAAAELGINLNGI